MEGKKEINRSQVILLNLIPEEKENAVHLETLASQTGRETRNVKEMIKQLRRQGIPILSDAGGYWIGSQEEAELFFTGMKKQALCRLKTIGDMKKCMMNYYKGEN
jgi:biotin operon repressor